MEPVAGGYGRGDGIRGCIVAARGDRPQPQPPHRSLPNDLENLWRRLLSWGTGRATTPTEFAGTEHHTEWSALTRELKSFRTRLRLLLAYLGIEWPGDKSDVADAGSSRSVEPASPGKETNHPLADTPGLDTAAVAVLMFLGKEHPKLMRNVDIEVATDLSKQTVSNAVAELIDNKLANRPKGDRKGTTLTSEGHALWERWRRSSTDHP